MTTQKLRPLPFFGLAGAIYVASPSTNVELMDGAAEDEADTDDDDDEDECVGLGTALLLLLLLPRGSSEGVVGCC